MNTVTCQLCGELIQGALYGHLGEQHNIAAQQYLAQYPGAPLVAPELLSQIQSGKSVKRTPVKAREEFRIHDAVLRKRNGASPIVPNLDPHYQFPPEAAYLIQSINYNEHVMIVGPTGTGKSSLVLQLAAIRHVSLCLIPSRRNGLPAGFKQTV